MNKQTVFAGALGLSTAVFVAIGLSSGAGASHAGGMTAMSIDLDVAGNTATSLGTLQDCRQVSPGETLSIDITAEEIPASNPMVGFAFTLSFPPGVVTIEASDAGYLIGELPGSSTFDASDPVPDGAGTWRGDALDIGNPATVSESGSGVLRRIDISVDAAAPAGLYALTLSYVAHIDPANEAYAPDVVRSASLSVGAACATPTPSPTVAVTATPCACDPVPLPTPTPTPGTLPDTGGRDAARSKRLALLGIIGVLAMGAGAALSVRGGRRR